MMEERMVIQIAVATDGEVDTLVALCDDGTIWRGVCGHDVSWQRVSPVPGTAGARS